MKKTKKHIFGNMPFPMRAGDEHRFVMLIKQLLIIKKLIFMKKKLIMASIGMLAISVTTIISCGKDEVFDDSCDLDVEFRTPITKSAPSDLDINTNEYDANERRNKEYNSLPNCCGINTLVDAWIAAKGKEYFRMSECPMTAQQYYDKLINECMNDSSYHWTPESASMNLSTLKKLNEKFPLNKDTKTNQNIYTFSDSKEFNNPLDVSDFFSDPNNRTSVRGIMLENSDGVGHIANVKSCTKKTINFTGYDIFLDNGSYRGGSISTDGSSKGGWRIVGVLLK